MQIQTWVLCDFNNKYCRYNIDLVRNILKLFKTLHCSFIWLSLFSERNKRKIDLKINDPKYTRIFPLSFQDITTCKRACFSWNESEGAYFLTI